MQKSDYSNDGLIRLGKEFLLAKIFKIDQNRLPIFACIVVIFTRTIKNNYEDNETYRMKKKTRKPVLSFNRLIQLVYLVRSMETL